MFMVQIAGKPSAPGGCSPSIKNIAFLLHHDKHLFAFTEAHLRQAEGKIKEFRIL